jgi:hypothetical protein
MHCATSQKVAGSIPDKVTRFFNWPGPFSHTMALGLTQPVIEMSIRNHPRSKGWPARKTDNLTIIRKPIVWKMWKLQCLTTPGLHLCRWLHLAGHSKWTQDSTYRGRAIQNLNQSAFKLQLLNCGSQSSGYKEYFFYDAILYNLVEIRHCYTGACCHRLYLWRVSQADKEASIRMKGPEDNQYVPTKS